MLHTDRHVTFSIGIDRLQEPQYKSDARFCDHRHFPSLVLHIQTDDNQELHHCVEFSGYRLSELRHAFLFSWFTELSHCVPHARPGWSVAQENSMRAGPMRYQPSGLFQTLSLFLTFLCSDTTLYFSLSTPCLLAMCIRDGGIYLSHDLYRRHDCLAVVSDSLVQSDGRRPIS